MFIGLLVMLDPLTSLVFVSALMSNHTPAEKRRDNFAAVATFVVAMLVFGFFGVRFLAIFGISIEAFQVAGGIMIMFYGLSMMGLITLPSLSSESLEESGGSVGIIPMGIPMMAGPGSITTIIIYSGLHDSMAHMILLVAVVFSVAAVMLLAFTVWSRLSQYVDPTVVNVMARITGLILAAIAVEFVLDGVMAHNVVHGMH